jgi:hypothetical protein
MLSGRALAVVDLHLTRGVLVALVVQPSGSRSRRRRRPRRVPTAEWSENGLLRGLSGGSAAGAVPLPSCCCAAELGAAAAAAVELWWLRVRLLRHDGRAASWARG